MSNDLFGTSERKGVGFGFDSEFENGKDEWLTPPEITQDLGPFDLDPCSPINRPWPTAKSHYTFQDNGLMKPWHGLVFCNPPYGRQLGIWLALCARHNNCIALVFARTETQAFQDHVWPKATSLLFIYGRIAFYHVTGQKADCAGAPSVLIAYGPQADERLRANKSIKGRYVRNL